MRPTTHVKYLLPLLGVLALNACKDPDEGSDNAQTGDGDGDTAEPVKIGKEGGTVAFEGIELIIPKGALEESVNVVISRAQDLEPASGRVLAKAYSLSPDGLVFSKPALARVSYSGSLEDEPALYLSAKGDRWTEISDSSFDESENTVVGSVEHFSFISLQIAGESSNISSGSGGSQNNLGGSSGDEETGGSSGVSSAGGATNSGGSSSGGSSSGGSSSGGANSTDAPCGDTPHGETTTRTQYEQRWVDVPEACVQETQTSTCNNGTWTPFDGTFDAEFCEVGAGVCISWETFSDGNGGAGARVIACSVLPTPLDAEAADLGCQNLTESLGYTSVYGQYSLTENCPLVAGECLVDFEGGGQARLRPDSYSAFYGSDQCESVGGLWYP